MSRILFSGETKMDYTAIIDKLDYWKNYNGTGDDYRATHDLDCVLTGGNLNADTIFSLWLPLRYTLNHFECDKWSKWKDYEYDELKPKRMGLKDDVKFLDDLKENIDYYIPQADITEKLCKVFELGQTRANVMILPERKWNVERGGSPYWEYLPHFLYDKLKSSPDMTKEFVTSEHLEMFFSNGEISFDDLKDLAGTGSIFQHSPTKINLDRMLTSYISILNERSKYYALG